jgi:hypothetical protein
VERKNMLQKENVDLDKPSASRDTEANARERTNREPVPSQTVAVDNFQDFVVSPKSVVVEKSNVSNFYSFLPIKSKDPEDTVTSDDSTEISESDAMFPEKTKTKKKRSKQKRRPQKKKILVQEYSIDSGSKKEKYKPKEKKAETKAGTQEACVEHQEVIWKKILGLLKKGCYFIVFLAVLIVAFAAASTSVLRRQSIS